MTHEQVSRAYGVRADGLAEMLGTVVDPRDPDRRVIEPWAALITGRILDIGSGTGRWSGHLAALGHDVVGLEPAREFVHIARRAHPDVEFRAASTSDLDGTTERWSGILAWYSLIHVAPDELPTVLSVLRRVLHDDGSLLVSFFAGPRSEAIDHPVATAYRVTMADMTRALAVAGFEVTDQQWHPDQLHAHITARGVVRNREESNEEDHCTP